MPKESEQGIPGNESGTIINIPENIKKGLPTGLNIHDIGKIDLREAESIASEDMPIFTEDDLIGTLEDMDLILRKGGTGDDADAEQKSEPVKTEVKREKEMKAPDAEPQKEKSVPEDAGAAAARTTAIAAAEDGEERKPEPEVGRKPEPHPAQPEENVGSPAKMMVPEKDQELMPVTDGRLADRQVTTEALNESELDAIVSDIVEFEEGVSYVMKEADVEQDREQIAVLPDGLKPSYEELFIDTARKYRDEELDYVHAAIVEVDYRSYIREIDEFYGIKGVKTISNAVELLGLTAEEYDSIEDALFEEELKHTGIFDRYQLFEFGKAKGGTSIAGRRYCRYLIPSADSLMDHERASIENDLSSESALIFEEDVEEIRRQFTEMAERDVSEAFSAAPIMDITDRVVILDDESDVDRFLKEFPEKKQADIKLLLKYLDGLFEKLPEEVIKKFTDSEYFDLYLRVLNELGV
ncbi:MAG: hypothetical protein A2W19_12435 [Spirochaetes bacterium RBG_16_49_21]|nr:MAG: hypothetical protein A2W19_12435 [Spirochaetes bacterium RBG_16_49_21]